MPDRPRSPDPVATERRVVVERLRIRFEGGDLSSAGGLYVARRARDLLTAERSPASGPDAELAARIASALRQALAEARRR